VKLVHLPDQPKKKMFIFASECQKEVILKMRFSISPIPLKGIRNGTTSPFPDIPVKKPGNGSTGPRVPSPLLLPPSHEPADQFDIDFGRNGNFRCIILQ